jgi:hypothetical protein
MPPSPPRRPRLARESGRTIALRLGISLLVGTGLPALAVWIAVAQPSLARNSPSAARVAPARLETHVRMLSENLAPRGFAPRTRPRADSLREPGPARIRQLGESARHRILHRGRVFRRRCPRGVAALPPPWPFGTRQRERSLRSKGARTAARNRRRPLRRLRGVPRRRRQRERSRRGHRAGRAAWWPGLRKSSPAPRAGLLAAGADDKKEQFHNFSSLA